MRTRIFGLAFLIIEALWISSTFAAPAKIAHQGRLLNASSQPISIAVTVDFSIFDVAAGGTPVWSETQSIAPDALGFYETFLGSVTPLPSTLPEPGYLQLTVDSEILSPRLEIGSVPFSLQAGDVQCSGCVVSADISTGTIIDANISNTAAISGTKINPNFGSQSVTTSGSISTTGSGNITAAGDLSAAGGFKMMIGPFQETNLTAGTTKSWSVVSEGLASTSIRMPWAGSVMGVSVTCNANGAGGNLTMRGTINGSTTTLNAVMSSGSASASATTTKDAETFSAGALIGCQGVTDSTWSSTTADCICTVFIEM